MLRGGGNLGISLQGKVEVVTPWPQIENQRPEVRSSKRIKEGFIEDLTPQWTHEATRAPRKYRQ